MSSFKNFARKTGSKQHHAGDADSITPATATTAPSSIAPSRKSLPGDEMSLKTPGRGSSENPFQTPVLSRDPSSVALVAPQQATYFRSRRVKKEDINRPWQHEKGDPRQKWLTLIPALGMLLGVALGGYMVYNGYSSVPTHEYCSVYEDDFSSGTLNTDIWEHEIQVGGFGNGQFEETTDSPDNVYVADGMLHIKPTLQDEKLITENNVVNLTALGTCTSDMWYNCVATTNTTNGTIINPARSARISTKKGAQIKFGRVEVEARLPTGDWLWPAIWMMPADNVYGEWPLSGEIDIAESRGNNYTYSIGGNNVISSALHWGPDQANDGWWRTFGKQEALHSNFNEKFHVFGVEWSEKYIYMYLDSKLLQVMYNRFDKPLWKQGHFPLSNDNGTAFVDPWSQTGHTATPFDQNFFLILNVAVGGTNGWFVDGEASKPWVDASPSAKRDFWDARDQWYPTWSKANGNELVVKSVKMFQQKGYNGC